MPTIHILNKFDTNPFPNAVEIDTTSKGSFKDLSPFYLGPIITPDCCRCEIFENLWQYSKLYPEHALNDAPTTDFYCWRAKGFALTRANRYPMGKGAKPLYSVWLGQRLNYIDARLKIYIPYYVDLVRRTQSYALLYKWFHEEKRDLVLRDFDGYDYDAQGMTLRDVTFYTRKSMGHAFVLAMMLKGELP